MTHENAIGVVIRYQVLEEDGSPKNISQATVKKLRFRKPNHKILEVVAAFSTNGADGLLEYVSVDGDLVPSGTFEVQAEISLPAAAPDPAFNGNSDAAQFIVAANL